MATDLDFSGLRLSFITGTLGQGGAERQLFYCLRALLTGGAQIQLLSIRQGEYWEAPLRALGLPIEWVGGGSGKLARLQRLQRILAATRAFKPNVIQSQHFYINAYAALAARRLGVPDIGAIRSDVFSEMRDAGWLGRWCLRLPQTLAANSLNGLRNAAALGLPAQRLHLLRNVVDTTQFYPDLSKQAAPTAALTARPVRVLALGRLRPEKRLDRLLRVIAKVKAQVQAQVQAQTPLSFKVSIAGDGPLEAELTAQAQQLGLLPDTVEFCGAVREPRELYQTADIFMLTSDREGTPNAVLEAQACGLPVVATRVGDLPELVSEGLTGLLAAPEDETALATALQRLLSDPALRTTMGQRARAAVVANYSVAALPTLLKQFYQAALPARVQTGAVSLAHTT